ncbi:MAG: ABC transporter ATP-binding protein [Oscillospiraceae bacterium]|jgi:oligopeptide/dipeptide ABC transporter ATP-binding protein
MDGTALLDIRQLTAGYPDGATVLRDVSLKIHPKEILCVIGESGCGKSTLLNAILRLPGRVEIQSGEILFQGRDLREMDKKALSAVRGTGIGVVYQEPGASLNPIRRIDAQFYDALCAHGKITKTESREKAERLLAAMDLNEPARILKSCPAQLSGGMNQRVAIALAMALSPDVLLADEPTSALDVTVQSQIVEELIRLRDDYGTALLWVTHNMGVVAKAADTVVVMYCGKVVEYGMREEVLRTPAHPYTRALLEAIPKLDGTPPKGIPGSRPRHYDGRGCAFAGRCPHCGGNCHADTLAPVHLGGDHWALCGSVSLPNL